MGIFSRFLQFSDFGDSLTHHIVLYYIVIFHIISMLLLQYMNDSITIYQCYLYNNHHLDYNRSIFSSDNCLVSIAIFMCVNCNISTFPLMYLMKPLILSVSLPYCKRNLDITYIIIITVTMFRWKYS